MSNKRPRCDTRWAVNTNTHSCPMISPTHIYKKKNSHKSSFFFSTAKVSSAPTALEFPQGSSFFQALMSNYLALYKTWEDWWFLDTDKPVAQPHLDFWDRCPFFYWTFRYPVRLFYPKKVECSQTSQCWFHSSEGIILRKKFLKKKISIKSRMPIKKFTKNFISDPTISSSSEERTHWSTITVDRN